MILHKQYKFGCKQKIDINLPIYIACMYVHMYMVIYIPIQHTYKYFLTFNNKIQQIPGIVKLCQIYTGRTNGIIPDIYISKHTGLIHLNNSGFR